MTEPDRTDSARLAGLVGVLLGAVRRPTAGELERGLAALRARDNLRGWAKRRALFVALAACLLALGTALVPAVLRRARVTLEPVAVQRIDGGRLLDGGYLSEVGHAGIELRFNEGSKFALTPGTRGRLRTLTPEGTHFELDHGTASFQITPNPERQWWIEVGPFLISVRGTDFTVVWDPATEHLEVKLRRGRVSVSGPSAGEDVVLRPGQNLSVNLARGETAITDATADTIVRDADQADARPAPAASSPFFAVPSAIRAAPVGLASAGAGPQGERRFKQALASGKWDRILADVDREGVDASVRTLASDDLFALADAARYRRRLDVARAALLAERERFPNSPRSIDALFFLGRVDEARAGGRDAAVKRYDEYLERAPAGTYASEALGRKLILVKELAGPEAARAIAADYLRRFPGGSYAEAARALQALP